MIIVYSIGVVVLVYVVCTIIDLIRQLVFEKMYLNIVNKYSHAWFKPFKRIYNFINKIVFGE